MYGNAITAVAGFLLASHGHISAGRLSALAVGLSLVMGGACALNNFLDRGIDARMARTQGRALASGVISVSAALIYAAVLEAAGFGLLALTNPLTMLIALVGLVDYVALYGWSKRRSEWGTLVGSISGAVPILAGYTAAANRIGLEGWLLFAILAAWQMPHFYAIAVYRLRDYAAAGLPVLPVRRGVRAAKRQSLAYMGVFAAAILALFAAGSAGYVYLVVMVLLTLNWLRLGWAGFGAADDTAWGRQLFHYSLTLLMAFSVLISLQAWLP